MCVCVCVSVSVCVLECIRHSVCVSWNGVEEPGRGTGLRVRERIRNYSSSLLVVVTRRRYTSYMKTATKTMLELFYVLQRSRGHKEHLKQSYNEKTRLKTRSRGLTVRKTEFLGVFYKNRGPKCK